MPKPLPKYRLHRPSGRAVVTINGRDHYLGPWRSKVSRIEYDRLVAEWLTNGRQLPESANDGITVVELIAAYLEFAREYYANDGHTTSEYSCMRDALRPVREFYGRTMASEFGPLSLKAVRQKMIDRGWARTHINRQVNRVRRTFKWGVENELVDSSVIEALRAVAPLKRGRTAARETEPVRPVCDEPVDAVVAAVSRQVAAMIQLQRLTGMRPGEVVQMRPCDVERREDVWVYRPVRHKTDYRGQSREVYLGPKAQDVLRSWLVRPAESYCFSPAEAEAERNELRRASRRSPMTPSQAAREPKATPRCAKRDRYDTQSYHRAIQYGCRKAGVPAWHPHQLRHACGTWLREEFGLDVAQVVLGHRNADVTQVYAQVNQRRAMEIMSKVG